jgi:putative transposase
VQLTINGRRYRLWRAVDQNGMVLDLLVQRRRNQAAAEAFLRRLVDGWG